MKISVIMSVYNTPIEYLKESIESILSQTYTDFEFIIVNDGSTDVNTINCLQSYSEIDSRIIVVYNEKNIGLTRSLNKALALSRGEYIARMDADDISLITRFQLQTEYLDRHPEIDVLGGKIIKFGAKQINEPSYYIDYMQGDYEVFLIKMLFYNVGPFHPTVMMRKKFLDKNGIQYNGMIKRAQDYALWIDCINKGGKIGNLNQILIKYRLHQNQITVKNHKEQIECINEISRKALTNAGFYLSEKELNIVSTMYSDDTCATIREYENAFQTMIKINNKNAIFDSGKLINEIRVRWIHKALKCLINKHSGIFFGSKYTYKSFFSGALIEWMRNYCLKKG